LVIAFLNQSISCSKILHLALELSDLIFDHFRLDSLKTFSVKRWRRTRAVCRGASKALPDKDETRLLDQAAMHLFDGTAFH